MSKVFITPLKKNANNPLILWLASVCLTLLVMIIVGGVTRLTDSGLSMVDWQPIIGIVPPLTTADWQAAFAAYQQFPQYRKVNTDMDLAAFKSIFYWEYGHRVLGRLLALLFFLPFMIFLHLGKIEKPMQLKLWWALVLGSLQGLLGWYMVKSGLVDEPRVSHYRLAAHLLLAMLTLAYLFWLLLDLARVREVAVAKAFSYTAYGFLALLSVQVLYGAFVAGSRAGYGHNTYPLMNGVWLPDIAWHLQPVWHNFVANNTMLQFVHRWLGAGLLFGAACLVYLGWPQPRLRTITSVLLLVVFCQFLLGVVTLVELVPISLASAHQGVACILLLVNVLLIYRVQAAR